MNSIKKKIILSKYFDNKLYTSKNLAEMFDVSIQYVNRILKDFKPNIRKEVEKLYYKDKKNIIEITNYLNISYPTVIKIIQRHDNEYFIEKKKREKKALISKRKCKSSYIQNKRKEERELSYYPMNMGNFQQKMTIRISDEKLSK